MLIFDLETVADASVVALLPPCEPAGNLKDPEKIAASIAERTAKRLAGLALDPDCCRIVALGYATPQDGVIVLTCPSEETERAALETFWTLWAAPGSQPVGYNCVGFDLPVLIQRSRILNVVTPRISLKKYGSPDCLDLMLELSFGGLTEYKSLTFWCQRFGLAVPEDTTKGSDIGFLAAQGDWPAVLAHCAADVTKTQALAHRLHAERVTL